MPSVGANSGLVGQKNTNCNKLNVELELRSQKWR